MKFDTDGRYGAGVKGDNGVVSINGVQVLGPSAQFGGWFGDGRLVAQVYGSQPACIVAYPGGEVLAEHGANDLQAAGGVMAGWLAGLGLFSTVGFGGRELRLKSVGPDGAIAYCPESGFPISVHLRDGRDVVIADHDWQKVTLMGGATAILYHNDASVSYLQGVGVSVADGLPARFYGYTQNGDWCAYQDETNGGRVVVRSKRDGLHGYVIAAPLAYGIALEVTEGAVRVGFARAEGEQPGDLVVRSFAASEPMVRLDAPHPEEPHEPKEEPTVDIELLLTPRIDIVQAVHRDYPNLDAGETVDQVIHRLNREYKTDVFGRKLKNDGHTLNDDVVTILLDRNDRGKKKLIDILGAGNPANAMWDVRPASEEPGNGTWTPAATADRDGGSQNDPGDEDDAPKTHPYTRDDNERNECNFIMPDGRQCDQPREAAIHDQVTDPAEPDEPKPDEPDPPTGDIAARVARIEQKLDTLSRHLGA